jgi:endoglucanase
MKLKQFVLLSVFISAFQLPATAAQQAIGVDFFEVKGANSYTCWTYGSGIYVGPPATFTTGCPGVVPVDMNVGKGSLVFQTTKPGGGPPWAWWSLDIHLKDWPTVNFMRYGLNGQKPYLYLRVKWGQIASGAGLDISLWDRHDIWNLYADYAGQPETYSRNSATVHLSTYIPSPVVNQWYDINIPMQDFLNNNSNLDLTRIEKVSFAGTGSYSTTNTFYIEKLKVVPAIGSGNQYLDMVKVNQLGYLANERKLAIVSYEPNAVTSAPTQFQLVNTLTQAAVYTGSLVLKNPSAPEWNQSGDIVYHADFSSFTTPGRYKIVLPEPQMSGQQSVEFEIGDKVFNKVFRDALRVFYYMRCGQEINQPYAEGYIRPAIYANNADANYDYVSGSPGHKFQYTNPKRDIRGGWFDAGDLHLDTHAPVLAMWFLLETFEHHKDKVGPQILNLPESDSQFNDLINIIKWELDWYKKMQNADGSVLSAVVANDADPLKSYQQVSDVTDTAACALAGIFAKAYTLLKDVPGMESYSSDLLTRAQLSWSWLLANPGLYNPPGAYIYLHDATEDISDRAFAAIELYDATGDTAYRDYFENRFNGNALTAFGLSNQTIQGYIIGYLNWHWINLGYLDYAETARDVNTTFKNHLRQTFINLANYCRDNALYNCSYNLPMAASGHLYWGSSGMLCTNALVLQRVYEWRGKNDITYRNAALDVLDWIAGRNPVCRNFLTGYGDAAHGTDLYSFYWFDLNSTVPGYLCGNIDVYSETGLDDFIQYPWKKYMNAQIAPILEPGIYWQAQICSLLAYFASDLRLLGDFDSSSSVNFIDLETLSNAWLNTPQQSSWNSACDISSPKDNIIDFRDFAVFAADWRKY